MLHLSTILLGIFFCAFSASILSYLSIATMMGPWIAPTVVLLCHALFSLIPRQQQSSTSQQQIMIIQSIGSVGGAIATAIGFAFPVLFFLDRPTFQYLTSSPFQFSLFLSALCLCAGSFGLAIASFIAPSLTKNPDLSFPVSTLTHSVINASNSTKNAKSMFRGIFITGIIALLRDGIWTIKSIIPKTTYFFSSYLQHEFAFTVWPTMWAMGFTSGATLVAPLAIGILTKYIIIFPLYKYMQQLPIALHNPITLYGLVVAFCTGIVVSDFATGAIKNIKNIWKSRHAHNHPLSLVINRYIVFFNVIGKAHKRTSNTRTLSLALIMASLLASISFLSYVHFPWSAQLLFIVLCLLATYQICYIGGKIGLIQYGRFSTYVLIPLFLLYTLSALQITIICVFFSICAATASDVLFDLKTGEAMHVSPLKTWGAQWLGLIATSLCIGFIFYFLFSHFSLGTPEFFAQRSQAKALLLQTLNFNPFIVALGASFGFFIKKLGFAPTMVFGGIIMPNNISLGLIIGALFSLFYKKPQQYTSFCAGIFTSETLWTIAKIMTNLT